MLWIRNTGVVTFRIDKQDWERFCKALEDDKGDFAKPSQKVRDLVLIWTAEREQLAADAAAAAAPTPAVKKKAKKKIAKSEQRSSRAK